MMSWIRITPLLFCLACSAGIALAASDNVTWIHDYQAGIRKARETNRPVLVDFWAEWCGPCKAMDAQVYSHSAVIDASSGFVLIKVNFDHDAKTSGRFKVGTIPTLVFLDPWEQVLQVKTGFTGVEPLLQMMKKMPASFESVAGSQQVLAKKKNEFDALVATGQFYRQAGFPAVAATFYERALKTPRARQNPVTRAQLRVLIEALGAP